MKPSRRTFKPLLLTAGVVSTAALGVSFLSMTSQAQTPPEHAVDASQLTAASRLQAAPLPPACQEAIFKTKEKFPTTRYTVPDEPWNAALNAVANLSEEDQALLTESACATWNTWAVLNGAAVATELDNRYRNAAAPACNKWTVATLATIKNHASEVPAEYKPQEETAKRIWKEVMTKLSTTAADSACRTAYTKAQADW
ncbi:hypothetical protein [Streptomyces sp. CB00316]|uniref:hypothetical protein n=1 Tax=Streptomyces sp. CB00316 TaxID=1703932 RepID=UPI0009A129EF|nr:hypothetical protein [Streptomyces sp. CB00316]